MVLVKTGHDSVVVEMVVLKQTHKSSADWHPKLSSLSQGVPLGLISSIWTPWPPPQLEIVNSRNKPPRQSPTKIFKDRSDMLLERLVDHEATNPCETIISISFSPNSSPESNCFKCLSFSDCPCRGHVGTATRVHSNCFCQLSNLHSYDPAAAPTARASLSQVSRAAALERRCLGLRNPFKSPYSLLRRRGQHDA